MSNLLELLIEELEPKCPAESWTGRRCCLAQHDDKEAHQSEDLTKWRGDASKPAISAPLPDDVRRLFLALVEYRTIGELAEADQVGNLLTRRLAEHCGVTLEIPRVLDALLMSAQRRTQDAVQSRCDDEVFSQLNGDVVC